MSRQANGNYIQPANTAAVSGQTISSTSFNTLITDVGTEITNSLDRQGRSAMQAALPMGNNKITGLATPTATTDGATKAYVDAQIAIAETLPIDKVVGLRQLYHPSATSVLLGSDSNAALTITGAANNGSGLVRLTVGSTSTFATSQKKTVSDVLGTTEANGTWTITVIDATHIDLQGSAFINTYVSGGTIGGAWEEITLGAGMAMTGNVLSSTLAAGLVPSLLYGLVLSAAGGSGTFGIAGGVANDVAAGGLMSLNAFITKTTASWAVGSGNGGLDTGAIAINTWYHVYVIKRTDTGVVDVLFSLSASAPTMPASYTLKRRIGSILTDGSSFWTAFTQIGDQFLWATPVNNLNAQTFTAGVNVNQRALMALSVPSGIQVQGFFRAATSGGGTGNAIVFSSPLESDIAAAGSSGHSDIYTSGQNAAGSFVRTTNTSQQIGYRANLTTAGGGGTLSIETYGWNDARGK